MKKNPSNSVRIVHNRLLGGWFIVRGPHQTPISGRFGSKAMAQVALNMNRSANQSQRRAANLAGYVEEQERLQKTFMNPRAANLAAHRYYSGSAADDAADVRAVRNILKARTKKSAHRYYSGSAADDAADVRAVRNILKARTKKSAHQKHIAVQLWFVDKWITIKSFPNTIAGKKGARAIGDKIKADGKLTARAILI